MIQPHQRDWLKENRTRKGWIGSQQTRVQHQIWRFLHSTGSAWQTWWTPGLWAERWKLQWPALLIYLQCRCIVPLSHQAELRWPATTADQSKVVKLPAPLLVMNLETKYISIVSWTLCWSPWQKPEKHATKLWRNVSRCSHALFWYPMHKLIRACRTWVSCNSATQYVMGDEDFAEMKSNRKKGP